MRKIKIAQIGMCGHSHGREIFSTLVSLPEVFEIVGYALPEGEREKFPDRVKVFEGYREMTVGEILEDKTIEAVTVETDEIYLTKYAQMAAEAGKHIHMEKPGGISLEAFEKLIATVKANGTVFHTGYMYRYNPVILEFIERIKAGEIGEVVSVEAQMNCRHGREQVEWFSIFPGGIMFHLGCHMVDLVMQIQGVPDRVVPFNKCSGRFEGVESKDLSMAVLEYKNGASIVRTSAVEKGGFTRRQLVIIGTKGRFYINPLEVTIKYPMQYTEYNECLDEAWGAKGVWKRSEDHDRYTAMMSAFGEMVRGERENPYTYDYELELFRTLMKCCGN